MEVECDLPNIIEVKAVTRHMDASDLQPKKKSSAVSIAEVFFAGTHLNLQAAQLLEREFRMTLIVEELDPKKPLYWSYSGHLSDGSVSLGNTWFRVLKGRQVVSLVLDSRFAKKKEYWQTEHLTLIFQFVLLREKIVKSSSSQTELSSRTGKLREDLKMLLMNGKDSDITVRVQNGSSEFRAHRYILGARSPVLEAAFRHDLSEKRTGTLAIVDWDAETVWNFLFFLYTSYVEDLTSRNAIRLYEMADKYQVEELKEVCLECIENNLKEELICDVFRLALKFDIPRLLEKATDFFACNVKNIIATDQWKDFLCQAPIQANDILIQGLRGAALGGLERGKLNGRSTSPCPSRKKIKMETI